MASRRVKDIDEGHSGLGTISDDGSPLHPGQEQEVKGERIFKLTWETMQIFIHGHCPVVPTPKLSHAVEVLDLPHTAV